MKTSAGILLYRKKNNALQIFLVHPGGPFWRNKDLGAWSVPKGEFTNEEDPLEAAKREFLEETGITCNGPFLALSTLKQKAGKIIYAWAVEQDIDATSIKSNSFEMEWPPKSGQLKQFPEINKGEWFSVNEAKEKINLSQIAFIDELILKLNDI